MFTTLISAEELATILKSTPPRTADGKPVMVFDCTFDLMNPALGPQQFNAIHIASAVYVNLDTNLSAKTTSPQLQAVATRCPAVKLLPPGSAASAFPTRTKPWCTTATVPTTAAACGGC